MSLALLHRCARKTVNPENVAAFSSQSSPLSNNVPYPSFFNKNPRNLERLRIAYKWEGYCLEKPGRNFWHKLVLERLSRHVRASIVHQSGNAVVTASTAEWALNKFLYSTVDMTAYQSLAVVFSQRCLESGITEVYCNMEAKPGSKVASFLSGVEQGGLVLSEPARFRPQGPRSLHKPEKPWEVIE